MEEHDQWTPESLNGGWPTKLGLQYMKADEFPAVNINSIYGLRAKHERVLCLECSDSVRRGYIHFWQARYPLWGRGT